MVDFAKQGTKNKKQRTPKENTEQKTTNTEQNIMHFALIGAAGYIAHMKAIKETGNTLVGLG
jgi:outer membrane biogenesis lipoprotein LolB